MFGIGGFNPVSLFASAAFGPLGGIVAQLAQQVLSQVGQGLVQQLGEQFGLPQDIIDQAKDGFSQEFMGGQFGGGSGVSGGGSQQAVNDAISNLGAETGASPQQIGDAQNSVSDILNNASQGYGDEAIEGDDSASGGKGGWLIALARALGKKADAQAKDLEEAGNNLDGATPSETTDFQAQTQAFNMLMSAITNVIKTMGDTLGQMARKN